MKKIFICLANSYKYGGRCLAGIELTASNTGYNIQRDKQGNPCWIRPVMPEGTGEIPLEQVEDIHLMDVVELEDVASLPHYAHSEDVTFSAIRKVRSYPLAASFLAKLQDRRDGDILNTPARILTREEYQRGSYSLALIQPEETEIYCYETTPHPKYRVRLLYHGTEYHFSLTDPDTLHWLEEQHLQSVTKHRGEFYLTISLSKEYNNAYYKLVAAVFDLNREEGAYATRLPEWNDHSLSEPRTYTAGQYTIEMMPVSRIDGHPSMMVSAKVWGHNDRLSIKSYYPHWTTPTDEELAYIAQGGRFNTDSKALGIEPMTLANRQQGFTYLIERMP